MKPSLARLKVLIEKRSLGGWILIVLGMTYNHVLPAIQNFEWIAEKIRKANMDNAYWPPITLFGLALIWFLIVIFWPERRKGAIPRIVPVQYGKPPQAGISHGLFIANDSEVPAYEISIPDVPFGTLMVTFSCNLPRLVKAEGEKFCEAWIKRGPHDEIGGSMLFGEMGKYNVEEIEFPIRYKDGGNRWYQTVCRMERDVTIAGGLRVGYVKQETIKPPG